MEYLCRVCKQPFSPTPGRLAKRDLICNSCERVRAALYRKKRRDEGRPVKTGNMSREWHRLYSMDYLSRPGIRKQRADTARLRRLEPDEQIKAASRRLLRAALAKGLVIRQPCETCGELRSDGHHSDYTRPLDVIWLCRVHHTEIHAKARQAITLLPALKPSESHPTAL